MPDAIIDTDVVSFLFKQDSRAELYRTHLVDRRLAVCFMTIAELERWVLTKNWGAVRRQRMRVHLRNFIACPFSVDKPYSHKTGLGRGHTGKHRMGFRALAMREMG
jgi:predicted nucleic acid-binding protein